MENPGLNTLLFIVPGDPEQRTGGYRYVSRLVEALNERGLNARVKGLEGQFPIPDPVALSSMDAALADCEDGARVILDGLAMGGLPEVIEKHAARLRLTALVHHPLADETGISERDQAYLLRSETRALAAVSNVITTSRHTALRLQDFEVPSDIIRVVEPGSDTVSAQGNSSHQGAGDEVLQLLCVASLSPRKAQHQLVEALSDLQHLAWHCTFVGSTERSPEYSQQVADQVQNLGLTERFTLAGELGDEALAEHYRNADLFVLPSLYEGYGMVIDEAMAAGLPVITTDGGALANTGNRPGIRQYPAGSVQALQKLLEAILGDRQVIQDMAAALQEGRASVRKWSDAAAEFEKVLFKDHSQFDQQWLALREPADHRARNRVLLSRVQSWLKKPAAGLTENDSGMLRIVDLGSGAGSNGVYLNKVLPEPQHWTLLEQNPVLLKEARSRLASETAGLETRECTLGADNLAELIPHRAHLITASALIDLMSARWLDALAGAAADRHAAVYIVLSYAGEFHLNPRHGSDDLVRSLVNDHQHGDKGSGAALGPDATDYLKQALEAQGYRVMVESSPWILGAEDSALQAELVRGWCEAALQQNPAEQSRIRQWQSARLALAEQGQLSVQVNHHDLFAWPVHD